MNDSEIEQYEWTIEVHDGKEWICDSRGRILPDINVSTGYLQAIVRAHNYALDRIRMAGS